MKIFVQSSREHAILPTLDDRCRRLLPAVRPAHACVTFSLGESKPLADQARQTLTAIAAGQMPPGQGKALLDALASLMRVVELDENER